MLITEGTFLPTVEVLTGKIDWEEESGEDFQDPLSSPESTMSLDVVFGERQLMSCCLACVVGTRSDGPGNAETWTLTVGVEWCTAMEARQRSQQPTDPVTIMSPFRFSLECLTMVYY